MSRCGAVYLVLAEQPELDRLERCPSAPEWPAKSGQEPRCADHATQLAWVRSDPGRLAAYNAQVCRYDLGQRIGALAEQEALL